MGDEQFKVHSETDVELSNTISDHLLDHTSLSRRTDNLNLRHRRSKTVTLSDDFDSERIVEPLSISPMSRLEDTIRSISIPEENTRVPLTMSVRRRYCTDRREQSKVDSIGNSRDDKVIVTCPNSTAVYCTTDDTIREVELNQDICLDEAEEPIQYLNLSRRSIYITTPPEKEATPISELDHQESPLKLQLTPDKYSGDTPTRKSSQGEKTISYLSDISPSHRIQSHTPYVEETNTREYLECERSNRYHHLFLLTLYLLLLPLILLYWSGVRFL